MTARKPGAKRGHKKGQPNKPLFEEDMDAIADLLLRPDFYSCEIEILDDDGRLKSVGGKVTNHYRKAVREAGITEGTGEEAMRGRFRRNFNRKVKDGEVVAGADDKPVVGPHVAEERLDDALVRRARGNGRYLADTWTKKPK